MTRTIRDEDERTGVTIEDVTCVGESEKAIKVLIDGEPHWIPKSQVTDDSEVFESGGTGKLVVTEWFAEKEKLA